MQLRVIGKSLAFDENSIALAGLDLGNGIAAALVLTASATKTVVNATPASAGITVLLAANTSRRAVIVVNNGSTNLHIQTAAAPFSGDVAQDVTLAPGQSWDALEAYQGAVAGWWEGAPSGTALVTEIDDSTFSGGGGGGLGTAQTPNVTSPVPVGGAFTALPTPTTNGAALANGVSGVELTLPPGASVTYTIAASQPGSAPALVRTISNPSASTAYLSDQINLAAGTTVYVTAASGGAFYRTL